MSGKRILILYYSYSHQTTNLLKKLIVGLEESDIDVTLERIIPERRLAFPIGTIPATVLMMFKTFLRIRFPAKSLNPKVFSRWDLIIVAGPTWSFNPAGGCSFNA